MSGFPEGHAIVYCEGMFGNLNGKTAHGLVRRSERYTLVAVVDSTLAGRDAGEVLDGTRRELPIVANVSDAIARARQRGTPATHLVVGMAPDGGRLPVAARADVRSALEAGLNVDCGLHDFLSEDPELARMATEHGVRIRDIRKTPPRSALHFFSGAIAEVKALKVAVLGTDSAVGKRTTAWVLVDALRAAGKKAEMVGTGQTAWMQGARYSFILDSMINDFLSGEIEHAVVQAWRELKPDAILLEGQGSLLNPAYPGGYELLAAGRPDVVVLQHPPARTEYDGFPGFALHPIEHQLRAIEVVSSKKVVAITVNSEHLQGEQIDQACAELEARTGIPCVEIFRHSPARVIDALTPYLPA